MVTRFLAPFSSAEPFGTLHREINRVFDEVFRHAGPSGTAGFAPSIDVHESPEGLEVTAELPGCAERDIQLSLEGDLITIAGEKTNERKEDKDGMRLSERSYGRFHRSFRLPFAPDQGSVSATFDKGVLRVTLPKPAETAPASNRIPIRSAPDPREQREEDKPATLVAAGPQPG